MKKFKNDNYYIKFRNGIYPLSPKIVDKIIDDYFAAVDVYLPFVLMGLSLFLIGYLVH